MDATITLIVKIIAANHRARFDYEILETVEAGMLLTGAEVKSCREGHVDMRGAYVSCMGSKPMLQKMSIAPYRYASDPAYNPLRPRELLLHAEERERLASRAQEKGMTIVPLEVRSGKFIKILLGVARGRKRIDKRQRIRERETQRRLRQGNL
jgi:SsrA-binding protein